MSSPVRTTEIRRVLHEQDLVILARVVAYKEEGLGRVEAEILSGDNDHGPSATSMFETTAEGTTSVAVSIEEGSLTYTAIASFERGEVEPVTHELALRVPDPPGTLSLAIEISESSS